MKRHLHFLMACAVLMPCLAQAQFQITNTDTYYTRDQMLLANEINESGEPFAEALGYDLDELDPMLPNFPDSIAYTTGIENYEYSRYQLGTVVSQSGLGLHMMWAPIIGMNAANETDPNFDGMFTGGTPNGFKEDDELMKTVMALGMRANFTPFANAWPQFAEFSSGNPHLPQPVASNFSSDFSTLRWDRSQMSMELNPGAMGQTMVKQYLWAQDMLGAFHDMNENEVSPEDGNPDMANGMFDPNNGIFYGGDNIDGFVGMVLTAEAINKAMFLRTQLAFDGTSLGSVDPASYDPANGIRYFPHRIAVSEEMVHPMLPPRPTAFEVVDASSHLFDQLSLLWGTLSFRNMMRPDLNDEAHLAYHHVFDGDPFPAPASVTGSPGPFDLMSGLSKVLLLNIAAMHFDPQQGTLTDIALLDNGTVVQQPELSATSAGYALLILAQMAEEFAGTPLQTMAENMLQAQADYTLNHFQDGTDGYFNGYIIGTGPDATPKKASTQAAIARGLYAAYAYTGNTAYLDGADLAYQVLIDKFYVPSLHVFRTEEGNDVAAYTPWNVAIITGSLREAALVGGHTEAPLIFTRFFKTVGNRMQLGEGPPTGETGNDSDNDGIPFIPEQPDQLPPIFASEGQMILSVTATAEQQNDKLQLKATPSPFGPELQLQFTLPQAGDVVIRLIDARGRTVLRQSLNHLSSGTHQWSWRTATLPAGLYFLHMASGNQFATIKVVKTR